MTICSRSIAYSNAIFTCGSSSSVFVVFFGFELMMKSWNSRPGPTNTFTPASFNVATLVAGTVSIASSCPFFMAVTIASSFSKNSRPKPSMWGFCP